MIHRKYILTLVIAVVGLISADDFYAQKKNPNNYSKEILLADTNLLYVKHINSIYKNDGTGFLDHVISYYLDTITDIQHITNRKLLHEIPIVHKDSLTFKFKDTYRGNKYEIILSKKKFQPEEHKLENQIHGEDSFRYAYIDNQIAYGAYNPIENTSYEIKDISIRVNDHFINIPKDKFSNLLTPLFGVLDPYFKTDKLYNGVDVWTSKDGNFIYIYIFGGTGGIDTYRAKLIFSKEKYLTCFVVDYAPMSEFGTFKKNFLGF